MRRYSTTGRTDRSDPREKSYRSSPPVWLISIIAIIYVVVVTWLYQTGNISNELLVIFLFGSILPAILFIAYFANWIIKKRKKIQTDTEYRIDKPKIDKLFVISTTILLVVYIIPITVYFRQSIEQLVLLLIYPITFFVAFMFNTIEKFLRQRRKKPIVDAVDIDSGKIDFKKESISSERIESLKHLMGFDESSQMKEYVNGFQITITEKSKYYPYFQKIKIIINEALNALNLTAQLSSDSMLSLDIKRRESLISFTRNPFSVPLLDNVYILDSPTPEIWEPMLKKTMLSQDLRMLRPYLELFSLKGQFIEAMVYSEKAVEKLLEWVIKLNPSLVKETRSIVVSEADLLLCYNCEDPFDPLEEVCDNCNSPRPRCIICFQDLKPEIDIDVVILPCCKIYAHKDHMIVWLRKKPNCPNCHANLSRWVNKIGI